MNDEERAAFRAFVREHHPDRGGDPEVFTAGLARFGTQGADPPPMTAARQAEPVDTPSHIDPPAPVDPPGPVDVAALPFPVRVGVALIRTWHRRRSPQADPPPADHL